MSGASSTVPAILDGMQYRTVIDDDQNPLSEVAYSLAPFANSGQLETGTRLNNSVL